MRRLVPVGVAAVAALVVLALPASASFDRHFSVISKETSSHQSGDSSTFRFTDQLFATFNPDDQVGRDQGHCTRSRGGHKFKCHALAHLNGEVGGFGFIYVNGNFGRGDRRLNVVGGTDDFDGVAGKLVLRRGNRLHFDLVR